MAVSKPEHIAQQNGEKKKMYTHTPRGIIKN